MLIKKFFNNLQKCESETFNNSIVVWDTDAVEINVTVVEKMVSSGCLSVICVGNHADTLHDLVDATVEEFELNNGVELDLDSRGGSITSYSLIDGIWEAEHNMFEEVSGRAKALFVLSDYDSYGIIL